MSKGWYYASGDWNLICDVCGRKIKASKAKHRWDGYIVCNQCFEHRHEQDLIRTKPDKQTVPFTRPQRNMADETYVNITYTSNTLTCTPLGMFGEANIGTADCARAGIKTPGDLI